MPGLIGILVLLVSLGTLPGAEAGRGSDVIDAGLPWPWLVFGFVAQALFMGRFAVQWLSSERVGRSVVPPMFWVLSLLGGGMFLLYFTRRGDPVGIAGQSLGSPSTSAIWC